MQVANASFESDLPPAEAECEEPGNQAAAAGDLVEKIENGSLGIVANLSLALLLNRASRNSSKSVSQSLLVGEQLITECWAP